MDANRQILQDGAVAINDGRLLDIGLTEVLALKYEAKKVIDCSR
jgi:5-methylthioadenosine/S-adenosylhomocysteine deaminase